MNVLITGGAGFIGSHVVKHFLNDPSYKIFNLDKLTYAGNLDNLTGLEKNENYTFIQGDITDGGFIQELFYKYQFTHVIHLAAESHVDRSIEDPFVFAKTTSQLEVVSDLYGTPTYAPNLVVFSLNKIKGLAFSSKVYHFSDGETMSWYDLAKQLTDKSINKIASETLNLKAKRPKNTSL